MFLISGSTSKRQKSGDDEDGYQSQSEFSKHCVKAGLNLKNGAVYNILGIRKKSYFPFNCSVLLNKNACVNFFRIIPEFSILRPTFHRKSASKY